ncbi:MAG: hypothetical protein IPP28_00400 [Xanthomonadales bacterium]|nr:hypothetical protein [Xanthomonadales bacterium]
MSRIINVIVTAAVLSNLVGCNNPASVSPISQDDPSTLNQGEYCETQEMAAPAHCKPGQRIVFLPSRFGNEQLPVIFAAANCDLRYSVVVTNGGVTCVFLRVEAAEVPQTEAAAAG